MANTLAAVLIKLSHTLPISPHAYFEWSERAPAQNMLRFLLAGEGDIPRTPARSSAAPSPTSVTVRRSTSEAEPRAEQRRPARAVPRHTVTDVDANLHLAQDPTADALLSSDPFALLTGMLLDQQFPMEHAFAGPAKILARFGTLEPGAIAAAEPVAFADLCATPPAIHRYGRSMAGRLQALAAHVCEHYDGDAERIWTTAKGTPELLARLEALPGFGAQKARIFASLLGKQLGVRPRGWREAIGPYAAPGTFRSVADVVDPESLAKVRAFKKQAKAAAKSAAAEG